MLVMTRGPIESRTRSIEHEGRQDTIFVEGGRKLKGTVMLQGAKNAALQAIPISLLSEGEVTFTNFPRIRDVEINLGIVEDMGVHVVQKDSNTVTIDSRKLNPVDIDPRIAVMTTGSRYYFPILVRKYQRIVTGPSGGDDIGGIGRYSFSDEALRTYRQMGIEGREIVSRNGVKRYEFWEATDDPDFIRLSKRFFGPTVQGILSHVVSRRGKEFTIYNPSVEPEIFETINLLNAMGANIIYQAEGRERGQDYIRISEKDSLSGTEFRIMSDPNVLVSYAVAALITDGEVMIEGIDHNDKVQAFLDILYRMGARYYYDFEKRSLLLSPSLSRLKPIDLAADFWPSQCHTDWQQLLTPLLAVLPGESFVDENVYPERFKNVPALKLMGADISEENDPLRISNEVFRVDGLCHTIHVRGKSSFRGANVAVPQDIRGATSVLLAALSAEGKSVIRGVSQIERGLENYRGILNSLGAKIESF